MPAEGRRFRPGVAATLATALAFLVLVGLGSWQVKRLFWKQDLIARIEAGLAAPPVTLDTLPADGRAFDYRRVRLAGELLAVHNFALGALTVGGRLGASLITPMRLADGTVLLVDRGWLPEAELPPAEPAALARPARARIDGVLVHIGDVRQRLFVPDNDITARRFYWLDREALARLVGAPVAPFLLHAQEAEPPELLATVLPVRANLPNRHLGYAVTWFGLAASLLVIYVVFGFRRGAERRDRSLSEG